MTLAQIFMVGYAIVTQAALEKGNIRLARSLLVANVFLLMCEGLAILEKLA